MTKLIANAFSLQMLTAFPAQIRVQELDEKAFADAKCQAISCVGHADTAAVLGVDCNRYNVRLQKGDQLLVAQLQGGRLPEGCTKLPHGFTFKYLLVTIE